jgi:hypothetical protein
MKEYEINLLPKRKSNVADKLLHFILYYFRYIIVITQIVVIGVFFFRFKVDQNVIDLKEAFKQKQQILAVTIPIVEEAKIIESKTSHVKMVITHQELFLARLNFLLKSIPKDITLVKLDLLDNEILIQGTASNVFSIRSLHRKLYVTDGFEEAEITSIERQSDNSFDFIIRIPLKNNVKE